VQSGRYLSYQFEPGALMSRMTVLAGKPVSIDAKVPISAIRLRYRAIALDIAQAALGRPIEGRPSLEALALEITDRANRGEVSAKDVIDGVRRSDTRNYLKTRFGLNEVSRPAVRTLLMDLVTEFENVIATDTSGFKDQLRSPKYNVLMNDDFISVGEFRRAFGQDGSAAKLFSALVDEFEKQEVSSA
jgi:hypothetical protein